MITQKTALILGAGASKPYGLPLGWELRRGIIDLASPTRQAFCIKAGLYRSGQAALFEFVDAFRLSQRKSIDAFLSRRPEFSPIGKLAIAALLLEAESDSSLFVDEPEDHWYRYLAERLDAHVDEWATLNEIAIVTFNYDRSLERYLAVTLANSHPGLPEHAAMELVSRLPIVHVYGSLGPMQKPDGSRQGVVPYGAEPDQFNVNLAASGLSVIPEGRDDSKELAAAKAMLTDSGTFRRCFLGFGFDSTNLARIGGTKIPTVRQGMVNGEFEVYRFAASTYGLTRAEKLKVLGGLGSAALPDPLNMTYDQTCLNTLRESGILVD